MQIGRYVLNLSLIHISDGTAKFTADLPIGYSYSVKEDQAPEGYVRNTEDVYIDLHRRQK